MASQTLFKLHIRLSSHRSGDSLEVQSRAMNILVLMLSKHASHDDPR